AGFGTGVMMNAKSHFQNAGSFFTRREASQPETAIPSGPTEAPIPPEAPEPIIPPTQTPPDTFKPIEEESPTPPSESPIMSEGTPSSEEEFQTLREEWMSPFKQHRINTLERRLDAYKDPQAMYKAQGSNAFTRAYRQTMTRDDKIRANIERRDRLTQRLNQLRGE
ncbi:hypothetical protein HMPREF3219_0200584, partial [Streptococcus salivarius]